MMNIGQNTQPLDGNAKESFKKDIFVEGQKTLSNINSNIHNEHI